MIVMILLAASLTEILPGYVRLLDCSKITILIHVFAPQR